MITQNEVNTFFQKSECKFKRIAPNLYDSGTGLICCVTKISNRKYIYIYHKYTANSIFRLDSKPVIQLRFCFSALNHFFSQFNFNLDWEKIVEILQNSPEETKRIESGCWDLRKQLYAA